MSHPALNANTIRAFHDEVLFRCAYPGSVAVQRAAEKAMRQLCRVIGHDAGSERAFADELADSGIAGTELRHEFTIDMLRWLARNAAPRVQFAWENGSLGTKFDEFLTWLFPSIEADGLLTRALSTQSWMAAARGGSRLGEIGWLVEQIDARKCDAPLLDRAFDACGAGVRWNVAAKHSRSMNRFPSRRPFVSSGDPVRRVDLRVEIERKLPTPARLSRDHRRAVIDIARATLAMRHRETDPVTYASEDDVTLLALDRGVDVALIGMQPSRRLPIDSFVGFVAARNRVPIAYGGGWMFGRRCEIGVNLFEEFRGGESAFIFSQVMRVYRQRFDAEQFLVDPYQFGAENEEAIRTGAFWFYYRLGFRPTDAKLRALADSEAAKIAERAEYRTSATRLRRLAGSKLYLDVGAGVSGAAPGRADRFRAVVPDLVELGVAVSRWIGRRFDGDRAKAQDWALDQLRESLALKSSELKDRDARVHVERLALLVAIACKLPRWTTAERIALVEWLLAKGASSERAFVRATQEHPRLLSDLTAFLSTATGAARSLDAPEA